MEDRSHQNTQHIDTKPKTMYNGTYDCMNCSFIAQYKPEQQKSEEIESTGKLYGKDDRIIELEQVVNDTKLKLEDEHNKVSLLI